MEETSGAVAIVSGGMDTVTLAHQLDAQGYGLHLSVDYGQRHRKELEFAKRTVGRVGARHDVRGLAGLLHGAALTDATVQVPDGHYAEASMRSTVVPNRNAILLSVAFGVAVAEGAELVTIGVHAGDHPIYPDCRPDFIAAFDAMQRLATDDYSVAGLRLDAPFVKLGKHDIVRIGHERGLPWEDTWRCYKCGDAHCGTCGTCVERREAFELAEVPDPTVYQESAE